MHATMPMEKRPGIHTPQHMDMGQRFALPACLAQCSQVLALVGVNVLLLGLAYIQHEVPWNMDLQTAYAPSPIDYSGEGAAFLAGSVSIAPLCNVPQE